MSSMACRSFPPQVMDAYPKRMSAGAFRTSLPARSEVELCAQLKLAAAAGTGDLAEAIAAQRYPRRVAAVRGEEKLRRIGGPKSLQTQIHIVALRKPDRLRERRI